MRSPAKQTKTIISAVGTGLIAAVAIGQTYRAWKTEAYYFKVEAEKTAGMAEGMRNRAAVEDAVSRLKGNGARFRQTKECYYAIDLLKWNGPKANLQVLDAFNKGNDCYLSVRLGPAIHDEDIDQILLLKRIDRLDITFGSLTKPCARRLRIELPNCKFEPFEERYGEGYQTGGHVPVEVQKSAK